MEINNTTLILISIYFLCMLINNLIKVKEISVKSKISKGNYILIIIILVIIAFILHNYSKNILEFIVLTLGYTAFLTQFKSGIYNGGFVSSPFTYSSSNMYDMFLRKIKWAHIKQIKAIRNEKYVKIQIILSDGIKVFQKFNVKYYSQVIKLIESNIDNKEKVSH